MRSTRDVTRRRATRLLSWYPREWRARYGEEFVELLVDDMAERPRSPWRALDVASSGVVARLATAGLGGRPLNPDDHGRRSLAAFGCAVTLFLTVALAVWAQVTIGWQWSEPDNAVTTSAMLVMSLAVAAVIPALAACAVPIVWALANDLVRLGVRPLLRPLSLCSGGLVIFVIGSRHFANGWPGTGGHPWAHQGIVPGGVAAFSWASTLFVTSYWLHPGALGRFPGSEVVWMLVSPLALLATVAGAAKVVRRLDLSTRILRFERSMGVLVAGLLAAFLTGAALWILDGGPGPRDLFHIGSIDVMELGIMVASLLLVGRALARPGHAGRAVARS